MLSISQDDVCARNTDLSELKRRLMVLGAMRIRNEWWCVTNPIAHRVGDRVFTISRCFFLAEGSSPHERRSGAVNLLGIYRWLMERENLTAGTPGIAVVPGVHSNEGRW